VPLLRLYVQSPSSQRRGIHAANSFAEKPAVIGRRYSKRGRSSTSFATPSEKEGNKFASLYIFLQAAAQASITFISQSTFVSAVCFIKSL